MIKKDNSFKNSLILFVTLLFVYIILFEFILPVNKILPRPSLLAESFLHIWRDYNLLYAFTITATVIYLMLMLGLLTVYVRIAWLFKLFVEFENSFLSFQFLKYIPAFVLAVIVNYYFANRLAGEFIFAFLLVVFLISKKLFSESKNVKEEYLLVARNLNLTPSDIYEDIYWKSSLPVLAEHMKKIHPYIWLLILTYEFIGNTNGIGSIYHAALAYNDFTALFTLAIIISMLIWIGNYLIGTIKNKLIHWTA
ncbi:hypothetical protein C0389_02735 [bacterium]|nr:hypothetical protein [bacterium]